MSSCQFEVIVTDDKLCTAVDLDLAVDLQITRELRLIDFMPLPAHADEGGKRHLLNHHYYYGYHNYHDSSAAAAAASASGGNSAAAAAAASSGVYFFTFTFIITFDIGSAESPAMRVI